QTIAEGDWLGEYLGEILPLDAPEANTSDYAFLMPGRAVERVKRVVVDAATHGNWTRFVNSSCDPNVEVVPEQVGKVRIIAFRAARDIHAGEQLLVFYGKDYFEERGLMCCCETDPLPHPPQ
ncbi:SET domain-containing protein, partial [Parathielavia hyrcaniae]